MAQTKTTTKKKSSGSGSKSSGSKSRGTKSSARGSQSKSSGRPGASRGSSTAKRSSSSTRSRGSTKAKSRSTGSGAPSRSRTAGKTKSGGARRKSSAPAKSRQATQSASNGGGGVLDKVKGPATAVGAALIGVAGGVAASRNGKRGSGLLSRGHGPKLSLPKPNSKTGIGKALSAPALKKSLKGISLPKPDGSMIDWVEEKAKGVGDAGYRVAEMTSDARRVKKAVSGEK